LQHATAFMSRNEDLTVNYLSPGSAGNPASVQELRVEIFNIIVIKN